MAVKLDAGDDAKRGEFHVLDPFKIIIPENRRGRWKKPSPEKIVRRALSMLKDGQIEPVECNRDEKNRPVLSLGFTRAFAARLIRDGFTYEGVEYRDQEFKLKTTIYICNEQQAFERNIVENLERDATSPVDDAFNQRQLADAYGYTDAMIAERYRYKNTQKVGKLRKLLTLQNEILEMVDSGELGLSAALDLCDLPADKRMETLTASMQDGRIVGTDIKRVIREDAFNANPDAHESDESEESSEENTVEVVEPESPKGKDKPKKSTKEKGKFQPLTNREIREYFEGLKTIEGEPAVRRFASDTLAWMAGKKSDTVMTNAVMRLLNAESESDEEDE
jgi:ParB-like chromosome segregation protein Spo0J